MRGRGGEGSADIPDGAGEAGFVEHTDAAVRLSALAAKVALDLRRLDYPNRDWVPPFEHPEKHHVFDVVIVGAGQGGLAAALALWRERIRNILVIDKAQEGQEGPWVTFARMNTLRTPKYLIGPDTGIADLTFPAWFSARFARPDWDALERIPRGMWMEYLKWCRRMLPVSVENSTRLLSIVPDVPGCVALKLEAPDGRRKVYARKVILANGLEGSGVWYTPPALAGHLPAHTYMHSADECDFSEFQGKRIGVLGIGASAVDCAATAAEAGAARVDLFYRRPQPPFGERRKWVENNGFLRHFAELPDTERWRAMHKYFSAGTPAPRWSLERLHALPNVTVHPGEGWTRTDANPDGVTVTTPVAAYTFDHLIFGTGLRVDLDLLPELAEFRGQIATWGDRYAPPEGLRDASMARYPYLGRGAELQERFAGAAPHLGSIHIFNWGATLSMGISSASITGMKFGLDKIIRGITRDFYLDFAGEHVEAFPVAPPEA